MVSLSRRGISVIECLIALTVFAVGGLGAAATLALALRMAGEGRRAADAARLLAGDLDRLQLEVSLLGGRCPGSLPVAGQGLHGSAIQWRSLPVPGGLGLEFFLTFPTVRGQHADTGQGRLACW